MSHATETCLKSNHDIEKEIKGLGSDFKVKGCDMQTQGKCVYTECRNFYDTLYTKQELNVCPAKH